MTLTEAPPSAPEATPPARPELRGLPALLGTGDHKSVGRLWLAAAAIFLLMTVVVGALLGFERVTLDKLEVLGTAHVLQFFSLYRVGLTFLVVIPLFIGLATVVVPLQVGASSIAFPRAAAGALWTWLGGAILLLVGYALDGGPVGGRDLGLDADAVALSLLGLGLVVGGLLLASVCIVTTVIALRVPRMSLLQVLPFSWSMLVAGVVWLTSLPVLLAGVLLAYLDLTNGGVRFGAPEEIYPRLAWAFDQPQVYVMAIPVLGIAAEVVPVAAGVVQRGRGVVWAGIAGFGALAFGAWAQPFYRPELLEEALYIGVAFAIGLPVLAVIGGLAETGRRQRPALRPALLLAVLGAVLLLGAVGAGAAAVVEPFALLNTTWQVGHLNLVATAALLAAAAGLAWWAPKIRGRHVPAPLSLGPGLLLAGGGVLMAVPEGITGALDQPAFSFVRFDVRDGVETLDLIAAIGSLVFALGALLLVLGLLRAALGRDVAEDAADPWGGQTLEWSIPSPPPPGNFAEPVPEVTSATPLVAVSEEGT